MKLQQSNLRNIMQAAHMFNHDIEYLKSILGNTYEALSGGGQVISEEDT
jgi:hypothetical protein